jgi:hypothetical protein
MKSIFLALILADALRAETPLTDTEKQLEAAKAEIVELRAWIADHQAFVAKELTAVNAAFQSCMGVPAPVPQPRKDEAAPKRDR